MNATLATVIGVGLLIAAPAPKEKSDSEKLQGVWVAVSFEEDGKSYTKEEGPRLVLTFDKDAFTVERSGRTLLEGTFTIDPSQKPRAIDFTMTDERHKGDMHHGIYELDGDTLKWCRTGIDSKERPTDFVTKKGGNSALTIFRREKLEKK